MTLQVAVCCGQGHDVFFLVPDDVPQLAIKELCPAYPSLCHGVAAPWRLMGALPRRFPPATGQ